MDDSLRRLARKAREEIQSGALRGGALVQRLTSISFFDRDVWVDELLGIDPPPPDIPGLPRGAVPYLPCGVEEILAMIRNVPLRPDDELVDLGSGLGRVVILGHLVSGARARGVEIQEPLVRSARACSAELGLTAVAFVHANAAELELDGSVFFLYAPFNGRMLAQVVGRLEAAARRRPIVVCAVGLELHDVPWLVSRRPPHRALALYDSRIPMPRAAPE